MKYLLLPCTALVALGLLSGCSTPALVKAYPGESRPADQIATVVVPASVEVRSINGAPQPNITGTLFKSTYTLATLPGAQDWNVRYHAPLAGGYYEQRDTVTETPWRSFQFTAVAGGVYRFAVDLPRKQATQRDGAELVRFSIVKAGQAEALPPATPTPVVAAAPLVPPAPLAFVPAAPAPPPPAQATAQPAAPQTLESAAFEQLKRWWTASGPHERQSFRDWLKTQP